MNSNYKILQEKIRLSNGNIHVFLLKLDLFESDDFISCLSDDERERANKLKIEEKKKQFVVTRGVLRKIISGILTIPAEKILFYYGKYNKPYIKHKIENQSIEFNVSHSGNYALIAITSACKIGIDIEMMNYEIDYQALSRRYFSNKEKEALFQLNREQQIDAFYNIWVRKESFVKAIGRGVGFGLDCFSVSLTDGITNEVEIQKPELTNQQWYCHNLKSIDDYKTALVSCCKENKIILYPQVK